MSNLDKNSSVFKNSPSGVGVIEAIILAGGLGERLKHLLNDKPFLEYLLNFLQKNGVNKYIFSLGYLNEQIISYLKTNWSNLEYKIIIEDHPLGTGGAIKKAMLNSTEDDILIVNADTYFDLNLFKFKRISFNEKLRLHYCD